MKNFQFLNNNRRETDLINLFAPVFFILWFVYTMIQGELSVQSLYKQNGLIHSSFQNTSGSYVLGLTTSDLFCKLERTCLRSYADIKELA